MDRAKELIAFTRHLYYLTRMGAPLGESLAKIKADIKDSRLRKAVDHVEDKVEEGETLSRSMLLHPRVFPPEYTLMIEVAEKTETLPQILSDLSIHLESIEKSRKNIRAAAMYPGLILNFALLFVFAVYYFVSKDIFYFYAQTAEKVGWVISPMAHFFINSAKLIFSPGFILIMGIGIVLTDIILFTRTSLGTDLLLKLPILNEVFKKASMIRTARTLGYALKQGIPLDRALETLSESMDSDYIKRLIKDAAEKIAGGSSLSQAFQGISLFDNTFTFMVKNGEDRENLPAALFEAADYYEEDLDTYYKGIFRYIEPAFIATVGLVVGFMAVSIFVPFYSITGAIH